MDERQYGGQRKHERITINREFQDADQFIVEYVQNISRGGIFIRSDDPLPVGTLVNLRFTVIMDELETIEGVGRVAWVAPSGTKEQSGMGVVFTELTSYSQKLLDKLLTKSEK